MDLLGGRGLLDHLEYRGSQGKPARLGLRAKQGKEVRKGPLDLWDRRVYEELLARTV